MKAFILDRYEKKGSLRLGEAPEPTVGEEDVLASDEHQWKHFYVQWGIGAVIVLGALEGAVMTRGEERLAGIAQRDLEAAVGREPEWSGEYDALFKRLGLTGAAMQLIVVVTIFFMALHL